MHQRLGDRRPFFNARCRKSKACGPGHDLHPQVHGGHSSQGSAAGKPAESQHACPVQQDLQHRGMQHEAVGRLRVARLIVDARLRLSQVRAVLHRPGVSRQEVQQRVGFGDLRSGCQLPPQQARFGPCDEVLQSAGPHQDAV